MNKSKKTKMIAIGTVTCLVVAAGAFWLYPNSPMSLQKMLDQGQGYEKTGKTALALKVYEEAIKKFPNSYEAHLYLGNALQNADETERAKIELDKAIELSGKSQNHYGAQIAVASMYLSEHKYEDAENALASLEDPKPKSVSLKMGELYTKWGDFYYKENKRLEAIDKYKKAFKSYDKVDIEAQQKAEDTAVKVYNEVANYFLSKNDKKKAIELLDQSIAFADSPTSHMKLAEIYKIDNNRDKAIEEFKKAYEVDTTGASALYLSDLLVEKGIDLAKQKKLLEAKALFEKAQEVNPSIIIPAEIIYSITLTEVKTFMDVNTLKDKLYPKISFIISNKGDDDVNYLKVKVVFMEDGKIVGEDERQLISTDMPLKSGKSSKKIILSSPKGVEDLKKKHSLQAKLYMAYDGGSDWKFARTLAISSKKKPVQKLPKKPDDSTNTSVSNSKPTSKPYKTPERVVNSISDQKGSFLPPKKPQIQNNYIPNNMSVPQPVAVPVYVQPQNTGNSSGIDLPPIED